MRKFLDYLLESKKKQKNILSWGSSFSEQRTQNEITTEAHKPLSSWHNNETVKSSFTVSKTSGSIYDGKFHDDDDVKPLRLTSEHKDALRRYTEQPSDSKDGHASSGNMNSYLRNRAGDKDSVIRNSHKEEDVKKSVDILSSAFTPENTNRKEITTYSGVPSHIGEKIQDSPKDAKHIFAGFTSTSSSRHIAKNFSDNYVEDAKYEDSDDGHDSQAHHHILQCHIQPGSGISLVHHSDHSENEVLLNHGAHATYSHSEHHLNNDESITHVHHVIITGHEPLEKYGKYTEK